MSRQSLISEVAASSPNRRGFLQKVGAAGATFMAASRLGVGQTQAPPITDADILQFALNLEYLEAEFYTVATTGKTIGESGIDISGSGAPGDTTGGQRVFLFSDELRTSDVAQELAADEQAHVKLLRAALMSAGVTPVAKPAINLNALGLGFLVESEFLPVARILEDVGVTAYAGAAPLIQDKNYLAAAARILATEAEHSGNIRLQMAVWQLASKPVDVVDIVPPPSGKNFFSTDENALVATRTPGQVLYLVYGNQANVTSGGFFPNGVNGMIKMSSASA